MLLVATFRTVSARDVAREDEAERTGSLIQRRMRLDRQRTVAVWAIVAPAVYVPLMAYGLIEETNDVFRWVIVVLGVVVLAYGIATFRRARRRIREFELEFGTDAGRRQVVS